MEQVLNVPNQSSVANTRLSHRWLTPIRILWLLMCLVALGLFIAGLPKRHESVSEKYFPSIRTLVSQNDNGDIILPTNWLDGDAQQAGLLDGDILLAVNNIPVTSVEQAKELIQGELGEPIHLEVRTGKFPPRKITVILGGGEGLLLSRLGITRRFAIGYVMASEILFAVICVAIGFLIFLRRSDDWMASLASLTFIILLLSLSLPIRDLWDSLIGSRYAPYLELWLMLSFGLLPVLCYIFPTGRFVPRFTLYFTVVIILWVIIGFFFPVLYLWHMTQRMSIFAMLFPLVTGAFALLYRYRYHSDETQRLQIRWIVWGALAAIMGLSVQGVILGPNPFDTPVIFVDFIFYPLGQLLKLLLPVSVVFAIQRYRLWDINILINRALVYGTLTTIIVAIYILVVGVLGTTIQGRSNLIISILATGLVAVLVQPLRDRLQSAVNRMMYGERDDPVTVLSRLGQRLEGTLAPDAVLPSLVEIVALKLKLPYVAIEITDNRLDTQAETISLPTNHPSPTISFGSPQPNPIRLPLVYQSETIGQLIVSPRAQDEALSPMDIHLLENIAHQAGMAVHAVSLTADLQRSRQNLVTAREEERRRLRRDLHDGLGPNLASQGLKLAAIKQLLESNPTAANPLLDQIMEQNKSTVSEVRRLVYGLRPPALDELGLVEAIRDHISGMDGKSTLQLEITEPDGGLPTLSAAVEVAAYRIVLEALTNIIRHAQAKHCSVRFLVSVNGSSKTLNIEIQDDGRGIPEGRRAGVGLRSMRERAEEIGGTCTIESNAHNGTYVNVKVPLITHNGFPAGRE